jgi:hypothetical protein
MGTTVLALSLSGKHPVVRLKLNACASGASISSLTSLRSLMLITWRSVLDLLASILMVSPTWHGPVPARSR